MLDSVISGRSVTMSGSEADEVVCPADKTVPMKNSDTKGARREAGFTLDFDFGPIGRLQQRLRHFSNTLALVNRLSLGGGYSSTVAELSGRHGDAPVME